MRVDLIHHLNNNLIAKNGNLKLLNNNPIGLMYQKDSYNLS